MTIADLEAAVRASWDRDAIAVYADHLQAIGDPRGELVAIDLRIDDGDTRDEVLARRNELIAEWFGADLPPGIVRYGFVDVDATGAGPDSQLAIALRGPGASYVRSVAIVGPPDQLVRAHDLLVAEPRPWLTKLVIRQWDEAKTATITNDRIVDATPALHTLAVDGRRVFGDLVHRNVHALRVSGFDAIGGLVGDGARWAGLATLDFAFHCHLAREHADPPEPTLRTLLPAARLPALRALDLSRNEPGHLDPHTLGGAVDLLAFLDGLAIAPQLETLHVPLRREPDRARHVIARMVALRELVTYGPTNVAVTHPRATVSYVHRPVTPSPPKATRRR
jgi:hypothetical protein